MSSSSINKSLLYLILIKWLVVLKGRIMHRIHDEDSVDIHETLSFSLRAVLVDADNVVDDMHAN